MVRVLFSLLIGVFFLILSQFFVPSVGDLFKGSFFFLMPFIVFSLLGFGLVFSVKKKEVKNLLRKFLLLTGASAASFFPCVFLHNAFYALAVVTAHIPLLPYLMNVFEVVFFLTAVFVCPIGFLVGTIGTIVFFLKKEKRKK